MLRPIKRPPAHCDTASRLAKSRKSSSSTQSRWSTTSCTKSISTPINWYCSRRGASCYLRSRVITLTSGRGRNGVVRGCQALSSHSTLWKLALVRPCIWHGVQEEGYCASAGLSEHCAKTRRQAVKVRKLAIDYGLSSIWLMSSEGTVSGIV
jgi:hypothetical protein